MNAAAADPPRAPRWSTSLRTQVGLLLLVVHLLLGAVAILTVRVEPRWLAAVELLLVASLLTSLALLRRLDRPRDLARIGRELLADGDFTASLRPVGEPEADALVAVYNRMREALRQERLRLEERDLFLDRLLAASPSGVVVLDLDGRIDRLNPAARRLLGQGEEALRGRRLAGSDVSFLTALGTLPPATTAVFTLDGRRRVRVHHGEFPDRGARRSFLLLEELTEELRASERAAHERVVRMVAHEVNNTVGAVRSLLESCRGILAEAATDAGGVSIASAGAGPATNAATVDAALTVAAERLGNLAAFVEGFATIVRLAPPQRVPLDVAALLDRLLVVLGGELAAAGVRVDWEERAAVPPLAADPAQLEQALVNVLKNAIHAATLGAPTRSLWLALRLPPAGSGLARLERAELSIRDSGPGIDPAVRERLFVPFVTTRPDGRGLGLALVAEVLDAHGLAYSLEDHPAGGAVFRLRW